MTPVRLANLVSIRIGAHLVRRDAGLMHLRFPGAEVKNGHGIEAILPTESVKLIETYIANHLPRLEAQPSGFLFPGENGRAKSLDSLRDQITTCAKRRAGVVITPHQFRHLAAMHYLSANPGAYGVVRLVNRHRSVVTTTKFYCGAETATAIVHFDEHVLSLQSDQVIRPDGSRYPSGGKRR